MKFNFNNLLQILKNNKFIILGAFILLILILNTKPIIEGLTSSIGEYDYLAPIPSDNKISDDIARQFADKSNEINCPPGSLTPCGIDTSSTDGFSAWKKGLETGITEPEAKYFIENGKFPVDGYIMNWVKNHPDKFPNGIDPVQKRYTNRMIYDTYIKPTESTMTPPPLAYNIYMGTAKPPPNFNYAATHPSSIPSSNTSTMPSTNGSSSSTNYNDFISLCKKTLGQ
jgi:hypothetical protein